MNPNPQEDTKQEDVKQYIPEKNEKPDSIEEEHIPMQSNYFDRRVDEEDEPVVVDEENQIKCEVLDDMFEDFFEDDFLCIAKQNSKLERDTKKLNDSSFVYGEIVINNYIKYNKYNKDNKLYFE